jgi:histidyl-tRNA synthetase
MRDFLPGDVRRRQFVIDVVRRTYERYGFEPLETPALENIETLTGKYGEEGNKLIFKVLRRGEHESSGETDLALRYDLTVPLARVVAEHRSDLPKFFKRYQIQPVWRADRPARGRFREFYQCDVDAIGSRSPLVEVELCAAVSDVMRELGFQDFSLRLNHRAVLTGLLDAAGVEPARHGDALVVLDKLDKIGRDGVIAELGVRQIPPATAGRLLDGFTERGSNDLTLDRLRATITDDGGRAGVENLAAILQLAAPTSAGPALRLDPSLARGLSYYTGAIMEIAVADLAGSLGGGGRYDGLIGIFSGEQIPACGFSLGLERILVVMAERDMFPPSANASAPDVLVTVFEDRDPARSAQAQEQSLALASELRQAGLRVELYPEPDKLGKQFKYAAARAAAFAAIVGSDELARGEVTLKQLSTGSQESVPRSRIASWIRAHQT